VHPRGASIGARGAAPQLNLELPPLAPAATSARPPGMLAGVPLGGYSGTAPGGAPIATLPPPVLGVPQNSETQEPIPVPPPPGLSPSVTQTR
jgi:hypothetical protein